MLKVGLVTTPLSSGHSARGIGFYTRHLVDSLAKLAPQSDVQLTQITDPGQTSPRLDIIHYPYFDLFEHTLPFTHPAKSLVTIHDVIPLEFPDHYPPGLKGQYNLLLQRLALRQVDAVITDSMASIKSIHIHLGVPHSRLKLIYLAAAPHYRLIQDKSLLTEVKRKYHLPPKFILYVGDINWNKNLPGLIAACKQISVPLILVGKAAQDIEHLNLNHPQLSHLKAVSAQLNSPHVLRLGFVPDEDLAVVYNLAWVYCQPSFAEGFGLPVLEALACGTPVACSQTHSLPEIAGPAVAYFDPNHIDQIVAAFSQAQEIPVSTRITQASKFSWAQTASHTLKVYQEIASNQ